MRRILTIGILGAALVIGLASCASTPSAGSAQNAPATVQSLPPDAPVAWTDDAWAAFQTEVPKMVQKIAKKQMEKEARERGIALIDMAFYEEIKKEQGR